VREVVKASALTRCGLDQLRQRLVDGLQRQLAEGSSLVESTAVRCRNRLREALEAVQQARRLVARDGGHELLAAELRIAMDHLGHILGTVYTDDILDRVFRRFCIGK
jgi:tRNA modification GTPase